MGLLKFLGALSPAHINMVTLLSGARKVGVDTYGNRYYRGKVRPGYKFERRWVVYKGAPEPSRVPPEWHGWLHHQIDEPPQDGVSSFRRPWQKPHRPNMTGTSGAYRPPGHVFEGAKRAPATGDYQPWTPKE